MKAANYVIPVLLLICLHSCKEKAKEPTAEKKFVPADTTGAPPEEMGTNTYAAVDISPMDMSYFPVDYPKLKMANDSIEAPLVRVIYSRPHLQKRRLFSGILKYEEPWRLGANESTEIDFFKTVTIQGKKVNAGRYIIYCIPHPGKWTVILNSNIDTWGLKQDAKKDIQKFDIPSTANNPLLEYFTMIFEKTDTGAELIMAWDDVVARLPIQF
jgi:Protein of unknown function (DUF2911)